MIDQTIQDLIIPQLQEKYFYSDITAEAARVIIAMYKEGKKIDLLTVKHKCRIDPAELMQIQGEGASAINIQENVAILKDLYTLRYGRESGIKLLKASEGKSADKISAIIDEARAEIDKTYSGASESISLTDFIDSSISKVCERKKDFAAGRLPGIRTGFYELDNLLHGWQDSDLIIIAARPSMGKTSLGLYHAKSAARQGKQIRIYSLEMDSVKLTDRLLLSECGFDHHKYLSGNLNDENLAEIRRAGDRLRELNIWIDDKPARSIQSIYSDAKYWKKEGACDIVIIDYLQLAELTDDHARLTLNERTSRLSRRAKAMAKDLHVPVLLLSQLNRDVERRSGLKIPTLADLRDSGAIEQDADIVIFIYRPCVYDQNEMTGAATEYMLDKPESSGLYMISKNRNGPTGYIRFRFNESMTRLTDYSIKQSAGEKIPF
jgi:replicative DNA helicase